MNYIRIFHSEDRQHVFKRDQAVWKTHLRSSLCCFCGTRSEEKAPSASHPFSDARFRVRPDRPENSRRTHAFRTGRAGQVPCFRLYLVASASERLSCLRLFSFPDDPQITNSFTKQVPPDKSPDGIFGADDGSRTHLIGLGSRSSTDELHPHLSF